MSDILKANGMDQMELREQIAQALKTAMKEKDTRRLSTLRLINAAIKDRDIAQRSEGGDDEGVANDEILAILGKMVKQRHESARAYEEGGRLELAEQERSEIKVIEAFLPKQLDEAETEAAINKVITETEASSLRDMGRVMGALKERYTGRMDFGKVGPMIKARLS